MPAAYALYNRRLHGIWCRVFLFGAIAALYFNFFVLIAQTFQKNPALVAIAPTQSSPAFGITQGLVLLTFLALGIKSLKRFNPT